MLYKLSSRQLFVLLLGIVLLVLVALIPTITSGMANDNAHDPTLNKIENHHHHQHDKPASAPQGASAPDLPDNVGNNNTPHS
jgi:hypothetical protein